jgi:hypothetical protein
MGNEQTTKSYQSLSADQAGELSIMQVFWQDALAFISVIFVPIIWAVFLFTAYRDGGSGMTPNLILIGVGITLLSVGVFMWRVMVFRKLFADNQVAQANITEVSFYRDRGLANFVFTYNGQKYITGSGLMKTKRTKALRVGEAVTVLVDRDNPKRAVIRKLYTREG